MMIRRPLGRCIALVAGVLCVFILVVPFESDDVEGIFIVDDVLASLQLPQLSVDSPPGAVPGLVVTRGHIRRTHSPADLLSLADAGRPVAAHMAALLATHGIAAEGGSPAPAAQGMKVLALQAAAEARTARAELDAMRRRDAELEADAVAEREEVARFRRQLRQDDQSRVRSAAALLGGQRAWAAAQLGGQWVVRWRDFLKGHLGFTTVAVAGMVIVLCLGLQISKVFVAPGKAERPTFVVFADTGGSNMCWSFFKNLVNGYAQCACGYTMHTRILLNSVMIAWLFGLGVMWHSHILQPFLEQVAVVIVFASLVVAVVLLSLAEMYIIISGEVMNIFQFLGHLTKQIDGVMFALGFSQFHDEDEPQESPTVDAVHRSYKAQKFGPQDFGDFNSRNASAAPGSGMMMSAESA